MSRVRGAALAGRDGFVTQWPPDRLPDEEVPEVFRTPVGRIECFSDPCLRQSHVLCPGKDYWDNWCECPCHHRPWGWAVWKWLVG